MFNFTIAIWSKGFFKCNTNLEHACCLLAHWKNMKSCHDLKSTHNSSPQMIYSRNNPGNWSALNVLKKYLTFPPPFLYQLCCKKWHPVRYLTEIVQTPKCKMTWHASSRCQILALKVHCKLLKLSLTALYTLVTRWAVLPGTSWQGGV